MATTNVVSGFHIEENKTSSAASNGSIPSISSLI
jgi:hypothetical protein